MENNNSKKPSSTGYQFQKLHKCVMLHYKTKSYISKVHCFAFPGKGEIINLQNDDEVQKYKVVNREFAASIYDRVLECTIYLKPIKK